MSTGLSGACSYSLLLPLLPPTPSPPSYPPLQGVASSSLAPGGPGRSDPLPPPLRPIPLPLCPGTPQASSQGLLEVTAPPALLLCLPLLLLLLLLHLLLRHGERILTAWTGADLCAGLLLSVGSITFSWCCWSR